MVAVVRQRGTVHDLTRSGLGPLIRPRRARDMLNHGFPVRRGRGCRAGAGRDTTSCRCDTNVYVQAADRRDRERAVHRMVPSGATKLLRIWADPLRDPGPQGMRNDHRTVGLLVLLDDGRQEAAGGQPGGV